MKLIFVGPSLYGAEVQAPPSLTMRPPAAKGDVVKAVEQGADVIGLIDGYFETTAAVWHKEILHALASGVRVFGAASIGALRAAECATFGMIGIGAIYQAYAAGRLEDDAEVALLHAPQELGYAPLSEPLVNVRATLDRLREMDVIAEEQLQVLVEAAASIFYKERTWRKIIESAALSPGERLQIGDMARRYRVDQKMLDAVALLKALDLEKGAPRQELPDWEFSHTSYFRALAT